MCRYLAATQTVSEVLSDRRTDENEAARVMAAAARPMARGTNFFMTQPLTFFTATTAGWWTAAGPKQSPPRKK